MRYVADGQVEQPLLKMGPDGGIPNNVFKIIVSAFETSVRLNQLNRNTTKNTVNLMSSIRNQAMNNISSSRRIFCG